GARARRWPGARRRRGSPRPRSPSSLGSRAAVCLLLDQRDELFRLERLPQRRLDEPSLDQVFPHTAIRPRYEDAPNRGQRLVDRGEEIVAPPRPDEEVGDEDVGHSRGQRVSRLLEVVRDPSIVMAQLDQLLKAERKILVVVENQDSSARQ